MRFSTPSLSISSSRATTRASYVSLELVELGLVGDDVKFGILIYDVGFSFTIFLSFLSNSQVLFNKYDAFALERVVGSARAAKLLHSDKEIHMFC
jgi:hypothetical protein